MEPEILFPQLRNPLPQQFVLAIPGDRRNGKGNEKGENGQERISRALRGCPPAQAKQHNRRCQQQEAE
jgi:hypothetical protein